tara:strand:+ start:199058 stop:199903 length:846 start_codon:yes stop_codon:yes gene_type:complete
MIDDSKWNRRKRMAVRCMTVSFLLLIYLANGQRLAATDRPPYPGYFLPGDAFFNTVITEEVLKKLDKDPDYAFEDNRDGFNLYNSGYQRLSLGKQNRNLAKQIKTAYYDIRQIRPLLLHVLGESPNSVNDNPRDKKTELMEINGLSLFFYNEDYDWKKKHIGLKYNENWYQELQKFGYPNGAYGAYANTPEAIIESWRFSTVIPPLSVQLPAVTIKKHEAVTEPMIPKGRLKALMLSDDDFNKFYKIEEHLNLIEITNEKSINYYSGEGEWHEIGERDFGN